MTGGSAPETAGRGKMKTMNRRGVIFVLALGGLTFLAAGVLLETVLRGHGPKGSELPVLTVSAEVSPPDRADTSPQRLRTGPGAYETTRPPASNAPSTPSPSEAPGSDDSVAGPSLAGNGSETSSRRSSDSTVTTEVAEEQPEESRDSERTVIRPPVRESDDRDGDD